MPCGAWPRSRASSNPPWDSGSAGSPTIRGHCWASEAGEGLRKVGRMAAAARVDLLRIELQRARVGKELLAHLTRAIQLADLAQRGHHPERADGERALLPRKTVVSF